MSSIRSRFTVVLIAIAWSGAPVVAHEGHDHAEDEAAAPATSMPGVGGAARSVVELSSELFEVLIESHGDHLDVWLDRYATSEPVTGAKLMLAVGDGEARLAKEESPGQYALDITPLEPGSAAPVTLTVEAGGEEDLLGGTLEIAQPAAEPLAARLLGGAGGVARILLGVLALALLVWGARALLQARRRRALGFGPDARTAATALLAAPGWMALAAALSVGLGADRATAHEGHDHGEEEAAQPAPAIGAANRPQRLADGSVFVPKPTQRILELRTAIAMEGATPISIRLAGEIVGDPRASAVLQTLQGGRIAAGPGGAWPVLGARVTRGQVLLRLTPSGSGGERASTAAESARVRAELVQAEAELARLQGLTGVVSAAEVDAARARVASLRAQSRALGAPLGAGGEAIASPIEGIIAAIAAQPGAIAAPGESLVTVIDPRRLAVEALAFEPVGSDITRASVVLRDGTRLEARVEGVGAQLKGGAIPVRLQLQSAAPGLVVGQPVVAFLERSVTTPGLPLPAEALVRLPSGERVVYQKVSAERFVPRTVRIRQVSADRIAVLAGLESDSRVVVRGAALVAQIR